MDKLMPTDKRMLELIAMLKAKGMIKFVNDFCEAIDIPKQSMTAIRAGSKHFTPTHIMNACKEYGVNANWVMGLEKDVFRG